MLKRSASAGFVLAGLALFSGCYACAQIAGEIIVTGTRIKQTNLLASSPITSLNNEDIATRGVTRIEDLINELPQVFAGQGSNISGGATGIATVDLRGLGPSRTLVLIDGRRMASGTVNQIAADLNQIPAALVKNIDVLTGGAGAVYGSDALAGVVNFQMERDFEGFRFDAQIGAYQHNNNNQFFRSILEDADNLTAPMTENRLDGATNDFTFIYGHNFKNGKGNITAYIGHRNVEEVRQDARDFSGCPLSGGLQNGDLTCSGSIFSESSAFTNGTFDFGSFLFTLDPVTGNELQRVALSAQPGLPEIPRFNFGPDNFFQRPDERYMAGIFTHYDLSPRDEMYADFMFTDDRSVSQIAPSGNFFNTDLVSCDNPFLSGQQRDIICTSRGFGPADNADLVIGRRNVEGGPRRYILHHKSYRAVLGVRGEFRSLLGFEYDVSAQHSAANLSETSENALSISKLQRALLVTTDISGNPVCDSVVDGTDPDCVPIDYFSLGGVTQAALDYVSAQTRQTGRYKQTILLATISGNLGPYGVQVPGTSSGAKIVLGSEYRKDDYRMNIDAGLASGDVAGTLGGPGVDIFGTFDSLEAFGELQLPLLQNMPLAKDVVFKGAYRYADNSLSGGANIYSAGGIWQVNDILRLRGQYQRAIRVASSIELFRPTSSGFFSFAAGDPCAGAAPRATLAQCANSGVTAAQYGNITVSPIEQFNVLRGGNRNLSPEKSDTFTLGVIIQMPGPFEGFTLSADYFDITVKDFIGIADPSQSINNCVFDGTPLFCNQINRDPTTGSLWLSNAGFVEATNINTGSLFTSGIDINANYDTELPANLGGVSLTLTGTYLYDLIEQAFPGEPKIDCVGLYGSSCGSPTPRWRHIASLNWKTDHNIDARFSWRHFANVNADPSLNAEIGSFDEQLGAVDYFDIALTYRGLNNAIFRIGINNVFDREPPITTSAGVDLGSGNTFPQVYDTLGRFLFARVTLDY